MKFIVATTALWFVLVSSLSASDQTFTVGGMDGLDPNDTTKTYRIGLALSGGGARGLANIGLLRAFEERGIEVVAIAGTSIGGVIGGMYACGYSPDDMQEIINELDFSTLFANKPPRSSMFLSHREERDRALISVRFNGLRPEIPHALTGAQELTSLLNQLTNRPIYLAEGNFLKLPIPFKTIATDIISGKAVVFSSGSLADALRASMAFPLAFTGVEKDEQFLMDGGMLLPVPVDIVRNMVSSSTLVVAVNTTSPLQVRAELLTPVDIAGQVTTIMTADKLQTQLDLADLALTPVAEFFRASDFKYRDSIINMGYQHGLKAADSIIAMADKRREKTLYSPVQFDVYCDDTSLIAEFRHSRLSEPFTMDQLVADLKTLTRTRKIFSLTAHLSDLDPNHPGDTLPGMSTANAVRLELHIKRRPDLPDGSLSIIGNHVFDDTTLIRQAGLPTSNLTPHDLSEGARRIVRLYRKSGYDLASVRQIKIDFKAGNVTYFIDEAVVKRIDVADNRRSKDWLIRSYFPLRTGKPYSTEGAGQGLADLYGTELFDRVSLEVVPFNDGVLMTIRVKEKRSTQLRLGWHWHEHYDSEEFVELLDGNLLGVGLEYQLQLLYGSDRQKYFTAFSLDRIFFSYFTAQISFGYERLDRDLYALDGSIADIRVEKRWGINIMLGQQMARLGTVTAGMNFEQVDLEDRLDQTETRFGLRTLHFKSTVETFDQAPFPTQGSKYQIELRFAGKLIGGEEEFTRFYSSFETYRPLNRYLTYHPRIQIGLSRRGLPASEKYYTGGMTSFSGYRTNELSGDKIFLARQELRLKLPYWLYFFGRFDIGNVYRSSEDIKLKTFKQGFGLAIALETLLGPFEFGYGGGDSPSDNVYFYGGLRF